MFKGPDSTFSSIDNRLQSLHSVNIDHPYIWDVYCIIIIMLPIRVNSQHLLESSHNGIHRNNEADKAAKSALEFEIVKLKIPSTDLKNFNKLYIYSLWQIFWNFCDTSKLFYSK